MKKIPTLFVRQFETNEDGSPKKNGKFTLTEQVTSGCEWVLAGEGEATLKHDGTCVMLDENGIWYRRYDAKHGRTAPLGFIPAQEEADPITGHWPGWLKIDIESKESKWLNEALAKWDPTKLYPGTYELVGPKINGNNDGWKYHHLCLHGVTWLPLVEPTFEGIKSFLGTRAIEGIVWHHPDGRMAKIKRTDFGLSWPVKR